MPDLKRAINELREEYLTWGKFNIHARLLEDGFEVGVLTVGSIILDFIKQGFVQAYDHLIAG